MNYELAKKLKDAGFPDKKVGEIVEYPEGKAFGIPNLSELIEALGDVYFSLSNHSGDQGWCATLNDHFCSPMDIQKYHGHGKTPEEAVANLWLELNKKEIKK